MRLRLVRSLHCSCARTSFQVQQQCAGTSLFTLESSNACGNLHARRCALLSRRPCSPSSAARELPPCRRSRHLCRRRRTCHASLPAARGRAERTARARGQQSRPRLDGRRSSRGRRLPDSLSSRWRPDGAGDSFPIWQADPPAKSKPALGKEGNEAIYTLYPRASQGYPPVQARERASAARRCGRDLIAPEQEAASETAVCCPC